LKLSFILAGDARSGGIKAPIQAACQLLERGHDIRLLVNDKQESIKARIRTLYLHVRYPHCSSWLHLFKGKIDKFTDLTQCAFTDKEIVVAHGWWAKRELQRLSASNFTKVHYIHGFASSDIVKEAWKEKVPKIVVASYLEEVVKEISDQKVLAVIPNGIDTKEFFPSELEESRSGVGTIFGEGYHKDPKTVLGVLERLQKINPQMPIRVFGACRRPKEISRKIYHRLASVETARKLYSKSLVWFLGSCSEGFPAPILEAMACGCAVVSTDCGGPRDMIRDGINGFLCEVGNIEQIVDKIQTLLKDEDLRQRFVNESQKTLQEFSWERSVDKLEKALSGISTNGEK